MRKGPTAIVRSARPKPKRRRDRAQLPQRESGHLGDKDSGSRLGLAEGVANPDILPQRTESSPGLAHLALGREKEGEILPPGCCSERLSLPSSPLTAGAAAVATLGDTARCEPRLSGSVRFFPFPCW